jgi:hypothetical protein
MDAPERLDERVFCVRKWKCRGVPLEFTQESVSQFFGGTMAAAARHCGVSLCTMKRICRGLGLVWPKSTRREHVPVKQLKERKKRKQVVFPATPETVVRVFPKGREWMDVSIDTLSGMFGGTQEAAAGRLGVSLWTLKRVCRRLGMAWPKSDPRRHAVLVASMELPAWHVEDMLV